MKYVFKLLIVSVLSVSTLCACGTNKQKTASVTSKVTEAESFSKEKSVAESVDMSNEEAKSETDNTASYPVSDIGALTTERDTVNFEALVREAGENEDNVRSFLKMEEGKDDAKIVLFGQDVDLTLHVVSDKKCSFSIQFLKNDLNVLQNAINEQLGVDGEEKNGLIYWAYGERTVTLYEEDWGCMVDIS